MEDAIVSYIEAVLDTDDKSSIPALLQRRASLRYVAFWHYLRLRSKLFRGDGGRPPLDSEPFQESLPFQLAHSYRSGFPAAS
ncbi:MAG: hypothetical protein MJE66_06605 [Proteobacteria bacterium]|nr:hypothetical protein [Pseudomonadota bacterium]